MKRDADEDLEKEIKAIKSSSEIEEFRWTNNGEKAFEIVFPKGFVLEGKVNDTYHRIPGFKVSLDFLARVFEVLGLKMNVDPQPLEVEIGMIE